MTFFTNYYLNRVTTIVTYAIHVRKLRLYRLLCLHCRIRAERPRKPSSPVQLIFSNNQHLQASLTHYFSTIQQASCQEELT